MISIFIVSASLLIYHLVLYGLILQILTRFKTSQEIHFNDNAILSITLVAAAYNEEKNIRNLLQSFSEIDYPKDKIKLIIVSDESTDDTNTIINEYARKFENIEFQIQKPRRGKVSALNMIEPYITSEVIISTDASTILKKDSIKMLVKHFLDENVGLVSGKMVFLTNDGEKSSEGLYWKYESWLKQNESKLYSIIGASGCLFAIRRNLYKQIHTSSPDDFERTLITLSKGYRAILEPEAIAYEVPTTNSKDELIRKIRMISTEWFALFRNSSILNPIKFPLLAFILFSHKIIRWLLSFISLGIFISSIFLSNYKFFEIILILQILLYLVAILELLIEHKGKSITILKLPGYWLAMNIASLLAFVKFLLGKQQKTWNT